MKNYTQFNELKSSTYRSASDKAMVYGNIHLSNRFLSKANEIEQELIDIFNDKNEEQNQRINKIIDEKYPDIEFTLYENNGTVEKHVFENIKFTIFYDWNVEEYVFNILELRQTLSFQYDKKPGLYLTTDPHGPNIKFGTRNEAKEFKKLIIYVLNVYNEHRSELFDVNQYNDDIQFIKSSENVDINKWIEEVKDLSIHYLYDKSLKDQYNKKMSNKYKI